ncbi:Crp/Fnr family transcriptional regulator [Actinomadura rupiterrae]|uniref:Crp/Fnr family transcriptional regulator n=1 Tax=Actinomadura rupiterrae TaxID=559627 RepID=UPI0020A46425|nr:Crp/Fnr family transcriptional regulator [Actinomadura rupiterrae]MCP2334698.1 CRP-like cAMP-binding protein [Actinomadura rupiterrae]
MGTHQPNLTGLGAHLDPQTWRELLDLGPRSRRSKGRVLMRQGDPGDVVMVLVRGRVKVSRIEADGAVFPLAIRTIGEVLGDIAVLSGSGRTATVETVTDCEIHSISGRRFLRFVSDHALPGKIVTLYQTRLQESERRRAELAGLTLDQRVCLTLDRLAFPDERGALRVDLGMSQEEFGRMVGASRNAVGMVLARLRTLGIIDTRPRLVTIRNAEALRRRAEETGRADTC